MTVVQYRDCLSDGLPGNQCWPTDGFKVQKSNQYDRV